jgi:hypothetical protein
MQLIETNLLTYQSADYDHHKTFCNYMYWTGVDNYLEGLDLDVY